MALINCPECDKEISDKAIACPNCGFPLNNNNIIINNNELTKTTEPCSNCGEENEIGEDYCESCGMRLTDYVTHNNEYRELDVDNYQEKNLQLQEEQLRLNYEMNNSMARCPRCGSTSLSGNKKGYGIGKGVIGTLALGPIGLVAGNIGSKKVIVTCLKCGKKFKM